MLFKWIHISSSVLYRLFGLYLIQALQQLSWPEWNKDRWKVIVNNAGEALKEENERYRLKIVKHKSNGMDR